MPLYNYKQHTDQWTADDWRIAPPQTGGDSELWRSSPAPLSGPLPPTSKYLSVKSTYIHESKPNCVGWQQLDNQGDHVDHSLIPLKSIVASAAQASTTPTPSVRYHTICLAKTMLHV